MSESAVATTESRAKDLQTLLMSKGMQDQLRMALPRHVTPERLARIMLTQVRRIPKLALCTRASFLGALMECAQLGLEPGVLGQAWILPYKGNAQLIVGYRGLVALAWRSSQISSIQAHEVYEEDRFVWSFGLEPRLIHEPSEEGTQDPKRILYAYAVVRTTNHGVLFDVMSRKQIEAVRARSASKDSGPWVSDYAEMAKKTVLKRLLKLAPLSAEMQRALALDDADEFGTTQEFSAALDIGTDESAEPASIDDVLEAQTTAESVVEEPKPKANGKAKEAESEPAAPKFSDLAPGLTRPFMNKLNTFEDHDRARTELLARLVAEFGPLAEWAKDREKCQSAARAIQEFKLS